MSDTGTLYEISEQITLLKNENARLRSQVEEKTRLLVDAEERAHLSHGVAELAIKHRDAAEKRAGLNGAETIQTQDDLGALLHFAEAGRDDLLSVLKFVQADPCFKLLGSVTHDEVSKALSSDETP